MSETPNVSSAKADLRAYIQRADRTFGDGPGPRAALDRIE
jgi:hypothetical protein